MKSGEISTVVVQVLRVVRAKPPTKGSILTLSCGHTVFRSRWDSNNWHQTACDICNKLWVEVRRAESERRGLREKAKRSRRSAFDFGPQGAD